MRTARDKIDTTLVLCVAALQIFLIRDAAQTTFVFHVIPARAPDPSGDRTGRFRPLNFYRFFQEISMLSIFRRLMKSEQGATAIEYTLIASLIAVAAIAAMRSVGGQVQNVLNNVANAMT
jgi:pilus assembly protein Flp/PilA